MRGSSLSGVCPSAGFTFDLLGGVGGCGSGQAEWAAADPVWLAVVVEWTLRSELGRRRRSRDLCKSVSIP